MVYFENIKVEELFRNEEKYRNPPFSDEELAQTEKKSAGTISNTFKKNTLCTQYLFNIIIHQQKGDCKEFDTNP